MSFREELFKKQLSDLKNSDENYKKWNIYFILFSLIVGIFWLVLMPVNYNLTWLFILVEAVYLAFVLLILYFFSRLSIVFLYTGWAIFSFATFLDFINEFTVTTGLYEHFFNKIFMSIGIIIFTFGVYIFISRYQQANAEIEHKNKDYESIFKNSQDAIFLFDLVQSDQLEFRFNRLNPAHEKMTGLLTENVKGKTPVEVLGEELGAKVRQNYLRCFEKKKTLVYEEELDLPAGKEIWQTKLTPIFDEENKIEQLLGIARNITLRKEIENRLVYLSFHDQLTGLYNRRYFENEMERLNNSRRLPIAVVVSDLDNLKDINDNLGHKKGDRYIKKAAQIIKDNFREEDIVARIGGDEFAVLLPETDYETALKISSRLKISCKDCINDDSFHISTGSAVKNEMEEDLEDVFIRADQRMYQEKKARIYGS